MTQPFALLHDGQVTPDEELYQLRRAEQRVSRWLADKWQLEALLGVGGMAAVYAARHRNGNRVAIKILHPEVAADERMRLRFLQEGYVANKVEHPGVVTVLDDGVDADGTAYIVMELLEGKSVEDLRLAAGGRLRPAEVLRITKRLLEVLRASHRKGIVHRDLKPENIFVTANGDVKVLDFGIARIREVGAPSSGTRTGVPMGTPSYMPPEQARGHWDLVDERSDLWAVGATMYASLTGKLVHDAETLAEMIASALRPVAPIQARAPYVPAAVAAIVDRALAFKKDARWRSAGAMQRAIVRAEAEGDLEPAAVPRAPTSAVSAYSATVRSDEFDEPAKTPGRRRRLALVAMLAGALLLGAMWIAWGKGLVFSAGTNAAPPESSAPEEVTPSTATAASAAPAPTEAAPPAETAIVDAGAPIQRRPRQPARPPPPSVPASSAPKPRSKIGPLSEDL